MDSYDLIARLVKRDKKTVTRSDLEKITGLSVAEELFHSLESLIRERNLNNLCDEIRANLR